MTPEEWERCDDPDRMLEFLGRKASDRKLRLFLCASCRRTWHVLTDERSRKAIEASERFADRLITQRQLMAARGAAQQAAFKVLNTDRRDAALERAVQAAHEVAQSAQTIPSRAQLMSWLPGQIVNRVISCAEARGIPRSNERRQLAALLRDVIGNPFGPTSVLVPAVLAYQGGAAHRVAESIYAARRFEDLPVLADVLEEAGLTAAELLGHLRGLGPHVLGCWALDTVLGRS
jgi:hypothetical protein